MGFFKRTEDEKAAAAEWKTAKAALDDNSARERKAGVRDETPEYMVLNACADAAARNAPWWAR
jgi:hypothetical protein